MFLILFSHPSTWCHNIIAALFQCDFNIPNSCLNHIMVAGISLVSYNYARYLKKCVTSFRIFIQLTCIKFLLFKTQDSESKAFNLRIIEQHHTDEAYQRFR